jgi:hypothetical protein
LLDHLPKYSQRRDLQGEVLLNEYWVDVVLCSELQ